MKLRKMVAFLICPMPSLLKVFILRKFFGFDVGPEVRIGLSVIMPGSCQIGARTRIGHGNVIADMEHLSIGNDVVVGHCNVLMGGKSVTLGDGAMIGRFNEINSILNPLVRGVPDSQLTLGRRAIVTAWHKIDFTDRVVLGDSVVFAGRLSSIWTHNRQNVGPVFIGKNCYVGSGVQIVPGASIAADCVVGLGAVITRSFTQSRVLIAGAPAKVVKPLDDRGLALVTFPSRPDLDGTADLAGNVQV